MTHSSALDERIHEKSETFEKYFQGYTNLNWFCYTQNGQHWAELKLHGPKFDFFAKACADNMYKALDLVVEKMERQIEKQKTAKGSKIHSHALETPKYQEIQRCIQDEEEFAQKYWEERSA